MSKICSVCNNYNTIKTKYINFLKTGMFGYRCKKCNCFIEIDWIYFTLYLFIMMVIDGLIMAITPDKSSNNILLIVIILQILVAPIFIKYNRDSKNI